MSRYGGRAKVTWTLNLLPDQSLAFLASLALAAVLQPKGQWSCPTYCRCLQALPRPRCDEACLARLIRAVCLPSCASLCIIGTALGSFPPWETSALAVFLPRPPALSLEAIAGRRGAVSRLSGVAQQLIPWQSACGRCNTISEASYSKLHTDSESRVQVDNSLGFLG
jgi:hypothetical protein